MSRDIKPTIDLVIDRILSLMETEIIKIELKDKITESDRKTLSSYLTTLTSFKRVDLTEEKKITEEINNNIKDLTEEQLQALIIAEKTK
jgi:hypothetical protein